MRYAVTTGGDKQPAMERGAALNARRIAIVGAGHNALVCACYLAKAGHDVAVYDRRSRVGGAVNTEELWPGYLVDTASLMQCGWSRASLAPGSGCYAWSHSHQCFRAKLGRSSIMGQSRSRKI